MYAFNAFQSVVGYALAPFGLMWLSTQDFPFQRVALAVGGAAYLAYTVFLTAAVTTGFEKWSGTRGL